jgi:hypothetical protein
MTDDSIYNIEYSVVNVVVNVNVNNVVFSFSEYRRGGRRRVWWSLFLSSR